MTQKTKIIIGGIVAVILLGGLIYLGSQQPTYEESSLPETGTEVEKAEVPETEAETEVGETKPEVLPGEVFPPLPANFIFGEIKEVKEDGFRLETKEGVKEIKIGPETEIFVGVTGEIGGISDIKEGYNAICQMPEEGNTAEKINVVPPEIKFK